ncbi:MAG: SIMPL domain-containing protein [Elainella sp. Prado103]|jgi:uncharacterized protein YggE|nr:SIMPL domain-containing protein [Elainella sp. Prado103]
MLQHRFFQVLLGFAALTSVSGFALEGRAAEVTGAEPANGSPIQLAQATPSGGTLYVTGVSQITAPADQAIVVLSYYFNSYPSEADFSNPAPVQPQVQDSDLSMAIDAAVGAGVAASNVKAFPDLASPGSMRVRMVIDQPSQTKVEQTIDAVNTAIVKTNRFMNGGAAVGYTIRDCQRFETQARQAAMTDAQQRAAALAAVANVELGSLFSLSESVSWGNNYLTTCPSSDDAAVYTDFYSLPMYDPTQQPAIRLSYSLSVTYNLE